MAAVALAASVLAFLPSARAGPDEEGEATGGTSLDASPADADYLDLQRQVNELRSDLLDERERRTGRQMEANGAVLVVLGIVIGIGGLWFYARFRAIADEASIGAVAARRYVLVPRGLLPGSRMPREPSGEALQPLPLFASAGVETEPATTAGANGRARSGTPATPRLHAFAHTLSLEGLGSSASRTGLGPDDADLHRIEETIADCTEAIRLDPDSPPLYLRAGRGPTPVWTATRKPLPTTTGLIGHEPDDAAAYLGRCHAKSELGRARRGHRGLRPCRLLSTRLRPRHPGAGEPADPRLCRLPASHGGVSL